MVICEMMPQITALPTMFLAQLVLAAALSIVHAPVRAVSADVWTQLNRTVGGKLHAGSPFSAPCFSNVNGKPVAQDLAACDVVQQHFHDPIYRATQFGSMMNTQWEACQATSRGCLLDPNNASDPLAFENSTCFQGSIPPYYIDVRGVSDVQAALQFAKSSGVHLVIKNSGHDYKGRSSAPGALSLWVHNLNNDILIHNASFVPEGCANAFDSITVGAGIGFRTVYEFADANNVTFIGGYHQTVVPSGGWVQAAGHSVLSPVFGLGIDRVIEFKVVTPDGMVRVVNACQNPDLFWALRGGGGGTFGIVLESTFHVEKQMSLVVVFSNFNQTATNTASWFQILVDNAFKWGQEGWGGHMKSSGLINVNPLLTLDEAKESVKDIMNYTLSQNGTFVIEELPSWLTFFTKYVLQAEAGVGAEPALASRLLPTSLFADEGGKATVHKVIVDALQLAPTGPTIILGPPVLFNYTVNSTSATPAWRDSLWHTNFSPLLDFNDTITQSKSAYEAASKITQSLRDISPNSGAYFNEGNVYEFDHETSFWGPNYPKLLSIKRKYDPDGLLDCWQCVGTRGPNDSRFKCYLPL
ncbi:FAD-binding domain-containing protein [Artomyces pyxidatus]|uniref:FAD-binding domain-containing protein n=1 Tax=Artomyces pyxidatus TaxID=48021 RepID=A0ACB8THV9_9AGAM|nr:FAD-binding domain-containing protein [Artomyces pyxidatus]